MLPLILPSYSKKVQDSVSEIIIPSCSKEVTGSVSNSIVPSCSKKVKSSVADDAKKSLTILDKTEISKHFILHIKVIVLLMILRVCYL